MYRRDSCLCLYYALAPWEIFLYTMQVVKAFKNYVPAFSKATMDGFLDYKSMKSLACRNYLFQLVLAVISSCKWFKYQIINLYKETVDKDFIWLLFTQLILTQFPSSTLYLPQFQVNVRIMCPFQPIFPLRHINFATYLYILYAIPRILRLEVNTQKNERSIGLSLLMLAN